MLIGDKETKENFKYLSSHGIRGVASIFVSDEKRLDELVRSVPENTLTGYHLYDIFNKTKKTSEIRRYVYDAILFSKRFPKSLEIRKGAEPDETTKEEEEKKQIINFDLGKFLKDNGIPEAINKL